MNDLQYNVKFDARERHYTKNMKVAKCKVFNLPFNLGLFGLREKMKAIEKERDVRGGLIEEGREREIEKDREMGKKERKIEREQKGRKSSEFEETEIEKEVR